VRKPGAAFFFPAIPLSFFIFVPHGIFQFGPRDILLFAFFSGPHVNSFRVDGKTHNGR
jgi:hypothetical protein